MNRVVAVVQARMGSQRLPGKVLRTLGRLDHGPEPDHDTVLDWVLYRLSRAQTLDEVVVATSQAAADDELAAYCHDLGYACERGSLTDVLDRVLRVAELRGAETVARVTADCPLVDPDVVDLVVREHLASGVDFTANRLPPPYHRTYPIGLDVEVVRTSALRQAGDDAVSPAHREHVMPYLYEHPERFTTRIVDADIDAGTVRWTIDTPEDLAAVQSLLAKPGVDAATSWRRLLRLWQEDPSLQALNKHVDQRAATDVDPRTRPTP